MNVITIACVVCGCSAETKSKKTLYCSKECKRASHRARQRDAYRVKLEEMHQNDPHVPTCRECGMKSRSLSQHILRIHKMSIDDYYSKHGCSAGDVMHMDLLCKQRERMLGINNPAYGHDGRLSSISKKFFKYENIPAEVVQAQIKSIQERQQHTRDMQNCHTTRLQYWLNRGLTEEAAVEALRKRQTTFSLNICIEKYGIEEGYERWKQRQTTWIEALHDRSEAEMQDIIKRRTRYFGMSRIACNLFSEISDENCVFKKDAQGTEYVIKSEGQFISVDFFNGNNKIIEFYGDIWHANPQVYQANDTPLKWRGSNITATEIWMRDSKRIDKIKQMGFKVLIVWEKDFRMDRINVIKLCRSFLYD